MRRLLPTIFIILPVLLICVACTHFWNLATPNNSITVSNISNSSKQTISSELDSESKQTTTTSSNQMTDPEQDSEPKQTTTTKFNQTTDSEPDFDSEQTTTTTKPKETTDLEEDNNMPSLDEDDLGEWN